MAYESTLLSSLIPIRYEDTIDSINDLDKSSLPLLIWKGTIMDQSISEDSRPIMRRIFNRSIFWTLDEDGTVPKLVFEL